MRAQEFATRLRSVKRSGGELTAQCPAHEDKRNSLSFKDGDKGVVVTCFAGCQVADIAAAVGLTVADLFTEEKKPTQGPVIVKTYDYTDEAGKLLYQVCFSPDTEVLTPQGWLPFPTLTLNQEVAQFSADDGTITFARPSAIQKLFFNGAFVEFAGQACALRVTPDHRMLVRTHQGKQHEWPAERVRRLHRLPVAGYLHTTVKKGPTPEQARVLAAFQADGHLVVAGHHIRWHFKKQRKIERLRQLLRSVDLSWREQSPPSSQGNVFIIVDRRDAPWLLQFLPDKRWSWQTLGWPLDSRWAALEELGYWDGRFPWRNVIHYSTSDRQNADVIAAVASLSGYGARLGEAVVAPPRRPHYTVDLNRQMWRCPGKIRRTLYRGEVWCCTVPSGFLVVRRSGRVTVAGNCRFIPKDFRQRRPDGAGGWIWKLDGVRRVLYGLPALKSCESAIICEGERDVETLAVHGIVATTNAGGAGKWTDDYSQQLKAAGVKQVTILPDNDQPGQQHAEQVATSCSAAGMTVKIVTLLGLPPKGDVSDWFQLGHTADDLRALIDAPPTLQGITPIAVAVASLLDSLDNAPPTFMSTPFPNLNRLLCGGLVPGELYYLAAKGGEGKSALAIELARHVSKQHGVLVVSQEMGLTAVVRRFLAQEAQVSATRLRQHNLTESDWGRLTAAAGRLYDKRIWLADHAPTVKAIEARLNQLDGVELILVDYLQLLRGDGKDSRAQIEAISSGLRHLSRQRQVAIFALSAVSARGDGRDKPSMHWLRGSGLLEHDPDVILLLHQPNPPDPARELIITKARDAQCGTVHLRFSPEIVHFVEQEERRHDPYS